MVRDTGSCKCSLLKDPKTGWNVIRGEEDVFVEEKEQLP
jgi:hypothetical protein